jgi:WD40 repeat protein
MELSGSALSHSLQNYGFTGIIGHSGEVFACRFDNMGQVIASGSMDRTISTVFSLSFASSNVLAAIHPLLKNFLV